MAKGAISKQNATEVILKTFPNSFVYDKEIRIPYMEEGEQIQLKCVLTCAKVNVEAGEENVIPGTTTEITSTPINTPQVKTELSQEEKDNLKKYMEALGL